MNGVMLQGFHWYLERELGSLGAPGLRLWQFLAREAAHLRAIGIDAVWLPPAYKAQGNRSSSIGYDVYDHHDLGEFVARGDTERATRYGTREELEQAISALHGQAGERRIAVYADVVLNHKTGGDVDGFWEAVRVDPRDRNSERWGPGFEAGRIEVQGWTRFEHAERGGKHSGFRWYARHFDSVDAARKIRQGGVEFDEPGDPVTGLPRYLYRFLHNEEGYQPHEKRFADWVSREKGNDDYLTGCDLDYDRHDVREEMKAWGQWLVQALDLDGVRLDAVKHIDAAYIREWLGHVRWQAGRPLFAVAEYIASETGPLHEVLRRVTASGPHPQRVSLFDFPLRFKLGDLSRQGEAFNLRELDRGTLMAEQPDLAVTFVENHDYQEGREKENHVREWVKPLAYAFILLRSRGYPCLFFQDYYGDGPAHRPGREYLDLLLALRRQFALGEEDYQADRSTIGFARQGLVDGARGAMAVVLNSAHDQVRSVRLDTARPNHRFYHLATVRWTPGGFLVVRHRYDRYGNQAEAVCTGPDGRGDFPADGGSVAIWLQDGVGIW